MFFYLFGLLIVVSILCGCKLTLNDFIAPNSANTGQVITLNFTAEAIYLDDDNATEYGIILQIPENWQVLLGEARVYSSSVYWSYNLTEKTDYETFYNSEPGYKIWVGTAEESMNLNEDHPITCVVKLLTGDFTGSVDDTETYVLKGAIGALREFGWETDDPADEFDFGNIADDIHTETISITKITDQDPPAMLDELHAYNAGTGTDIFLEWSNYDEDAQGDVVGYRIYQSTEYFTDVTGREYIEISIKNGGFYQISNLVEDRLYYFAVTAIDEVPNENKTVSPVMIVPKRLNKDFEDETLYLSTSDAIFLSAYKWALSSSNPYSGIYSAQSDVIEDEQESYLRLSMFCNEGELSFWYSVDSEEDSDFLRFYVNGTEEQAWSGTIPYTKYTYQISEPGWYQFEWFYSKDESGSAGEDSAWLDDIRYKNRSSFLDIPPDFWALDYIETLYASGITSGCGDGNFCPNQPVTRAQMAVFLERGIHGSNYNPPTATGIFNDVSTTYWAADWIEQLYSEGITSGCGNNNFCPNQPVTRAQMAVFLVRTFGL